MAAKGYIIQTEPWPFERGDSSTDGRTHDHPFLRLAGGTMSGAIIPDTNRTIDFGSNAAQWDEVFCDTIRANTIEDVDSNGSIRLAGIDLIPVNSLVEQLGTSAKPFAEVYAEDINTADIISTGSQIRMRTKVDMFGVELDMAEMASAPSARASRGILYVQDNGGKTELMVQFQSGSAIQIAIEA